MKRDVGLFIEDILESIKAIEEYSKGMNKKELELSRLKQNAIIREIEIIAEAVKRMRAGQLNIEPGYDGEYGTVHVFTDDDRETFRSDHQTTLF